MGIEQKAKAYDEALDKIRKLYTVANGTLITTTKSLLEQIFPELAESEDERIRKYLIDELKVAKSVGELKFTIPQPTREECIAYLEKQNEQKPAWNEEDKRIIKDAIYALEEVGGYPCIVKELKSLRPIKQEWNKEDKEKLYQVIETLFLEWTKETEEMRERVPIEAYNNEDYQAGFIDGFDKFRRMLTDKINSL